MPEKLTKNKKGKHAKKHGFLKRAKTKLGKQVNRRRKLKGRKRI